MHRRNHGPKSGGTKRSSKPEGLRAGVGFLGRGLGERCKLPQQGSGRSPEKNWILVYFGTKLCCFHVLSGQNLGGTNNIGVPRTVISGGDASPPGVYAYVYNTLNKLLSFELHPHRSPVWRSMQATCYLHNFY